MTITAVFANVGETLNAEAIKVIESTTQEYLTSNSTVIDRVAVLSQSVGGVSNETDIGSRRLAGSLAVEMEIEGKSENGTLHDLVQASIVDSFENYSSFLMENVPVLVPIVPTPSPTDVQEQAEAIIEEKKGRETNWVLLGSAVALSIVAVIAVLFVRQSRQSQEEHVRAFPVEQTAAVAADTAVSEIYYAPIFVHFTFNDPLTLFCCSSNQEFTICSFTRGGRRCTFGGVQFRVELDVVAR